MPPKHKLTITIVVVVLVVACGWVAQAQDETTFQLPASHNTYVVTRDLKGLKCVKGVGTPGQCAVPNQDADEGGYPWTKVKCYLGDTTVSRFAWSLKTNEPMGIFEAPASLTTKPDLFTVNVRIGKTCMKKAK